MIKTYVLDTNVLLHDPESMFAFEDNEVVIPLLVIEELDDHKRRPDEVGRNARVVARRLDELRGKGPLSEGLALDNGGTIRIELNQHDLTNLPPGVDRDKPDNLILAVAMNLHKRSGRKAILVTKDLNLRIKGDVIGLTTQDYFTDKVDYTELYGGVGELPLSSAQMETFYKDKALKLDQENGARENQFFVLKAQDNPSQSALAKFRKGELQQLIFSQAAPSGIRARNKEQSFALELLLDDTISIVTLTGQAGTGKTLLAVAAGLEKVLEEAAFSRLLITRPVMPMGEDLGFLPGSKEEKLRPWMQPIHDNLEFIFHQAEDPRGIQTELKEQGLLEMEALTYIRGRSIPGQYIICDEAQNLTPHMVKTLITRVGEGSKIVFTGDPEQIDHPYLDSSSNGLSYLVEKLKGQEIAGHVTLVKGERSEVAELGARLL